MQNYKHTLQLPKTSFPMRAQLPKREPEKLDFWKSISLYQRWCDTAKHRPHFILHDGPPYANGPIHLGHSVNKILKDIILKSKTMSGFFTPYVPGWDCHGLPIEKQVEAQFKKAKKTPNPAAFKQACYDYAKGQVQRQSESFKRLGIIGDFDHPYLTMNPRFEAEILLALSAMIKKGHLHYGHKPVHWCTTCRSALAEAEVEYQDKQSDAIDVAFEAKHTSQWLQKIENLNHKIQALDKLIIDVIIWTTTPWTLPANQAVAVHPDIDYTLITNQKGKAYLLATDLLKDTLTRYGWDEENYLTLGHAKGKAFEGLSLKHPFLDRNIPMILAQHVTVDSGTGAVHTAPAHGQEDYLAGLHYQLPTENPVDNKGCFKASTPLFAGQFVFKANTIIIDCLEKNKKLIHQATLTHSYPHCWRHKTPIIFRATPQWFIHLEKSGLRQQALQAIEETQWIPDWGKARMQAMLNNRPDWCISRQRLWGIPLAIWVHKKTHRLHPETDKLMQQVAAQVAKKGLTAWEDIQLEDLTTLTENYQKVTDVLDVWFDSGVTHAAVLKKRDHLHYPADLYLEGSDQYRGWLQSSLLTGVGIEGKAPYKTVLTHGFTVDNHGRKMSKSLGNVISPEEITQKFGADILRLWVAYSDYRCEMRVSEEILTRTADAYRRIRNTARFLLANLHDFDPNQDIILHDNLLALDQWIIDKTYHLQNKICDEYENYAFHLVIKEVLQFCTLHLGRIYLDIIKDRQYTEPAKSTARLSAQTAMYHVLNALVRWIAPILSFTAEEIWQHMPHSLSDQKEASIFLTIWYKTLTPLPSSGAWQATFWETIFSVREAVNKELECQREMKKLGSPLEAKVTLFCDSPLADQLKQLGEELKFILMTSDVTIDQVENRRDQAKSTEVEGLYIIIEPSQAKKCLRCWQHHKDVGQYQDHPDLCPRCFSTLFDLGQPRYYA